MSHRFTVPIAGAAFALYAALGAVALAQPPATSMAGEPMGPGGSGASMEHHRMMHGEHRDPTAHLRAILQLKPAQEPALAAFVSAMKPDHDEAAMMQKHDGHWPAAKTTPERLAMMEAHLAKMRTRIEAVRTFYSQLDPAQKKAFDEIPPMMMGGHEGSGHHHMRPGPAMGPPTPKS